MKPLLPLSLSIAVSMFGLTTDAFAEKQNPKKSPHTEKNMAPDTHELETVVLEVAQTTPQPFADPDDDDDENAPTVQVMPQVTVQSNSLFENKSYQGEKTRVGKMLQLPKDIPQSVTIVSDQLMRDRGANNLKDALRNVVGLTFNAGEGGRIGDNINLRGYSAVGDLYLDGLRDMAQYNREIFNLEQVEVLRGSASMLYGRGSTGGLINQVSKTPKMTDRYEINTTGGSFNYWRSTVDLNKKLNDKWAVRLNAMGTHAGMFRDDVEQRRWGFAPSITYGKGSKNEFTAAYYFLRENNIPDYGVPYFNGRPVHDVSLTRFFGLANFDYERNITSIGTLTYTHRINANHQIQTVIRQADYFRDLRATAPRLVGTPVSINDWTAVNRQRQARGGTEHVLTAQSEYNGKFETGPLKHQLLAGYSHVFERAKRWTNSSDIANPTTILGFPNDTPRLPSNFDKSFNRTNYNFYTSNTDSLYTQDTIELIPHWKVMGGVRFDSMRAHYNRRPPLTNLDRNENVFSYRSGLLYQPTELSTYYLAYGTSFNPSAELYQLDDRSANTPPEKSRNMEIGGKWELLNGDLSLRTAIFRTEKFNERNTDLSRPDVAVLSGKRHTDGIELEAAGRITSHWQVFGGVAIMRSNVDKASYQQATAQDKRPVNTANYTYNFWTTYTLKYHGDWKFGAGADGTGLRFATANNGVSVPGYSRIDAMIEYSRKNYSLKLNLFNLLNKKYYEGVYTGHVVPGTGRGFQLTLSLKK